MNFYGLQDPDLFGKEFNRFLSSIELVAIFFAVFFIVIV